MQSIVKYYFLKWKLAFLDGFYMPITKTQIPDRLRNWKASKSLIKTFYELFKSVLRKGQVSL